MPVEYLREISRAQLPMTVTEEAKIDKLRVLRAADLISAMLPNPRADGRYARVLAITRKGREMLVREAEHTLGPG